MTFILGMVTGVLSFIFFLKLIKFMYLKYNKEKEYPSFSNKDTKKDIEQKLNKIPVHRSSMFEKGEDISKYIRGNFSKKLLKSNISANIASFQNEEPVLFITNLTPEVFTRVILEASHINTDLNGLLDTVNSGNPYGVFIHTMEEVEEHLLEEENYGLLDLLKKQEAYSRLLEVREKFKDNTLF